MLPYWLSSTSSMGVCHPPTLLLSISSLLVHHFRLPHYFTPISSPSPFIPFVYHRRLCSQRCDIPDTCDLLHYFTPIFQHPLSSHPHTPPPCLYRFRLFSFNISAFLHYFTPIFFDIPVSSHLHTPPTLFATTRQTILPRGFTTSSIISFRHPLSPEPHGHEDHLAVSTQRFVCLFVCLFHYSDCRPFRAYGALKYMRYLPLN